LPIDKEAVVPFYCGMDLSARDCQVCVIDEALSLVAQEKVQNDLARILKLIEPFKETLQIVVESTFNWYWLVDGPQEAGYKACLAHTLGLSMITGAKVKTDRRDAFALAKLLKAGMIPQAYIYPKDTRPIRDLLRHRSTLVTLRAADYGGLRRLLLRHGILAHSRNDITQASDDDLEPWFTHPLVRLHGHQALERIAPYPQQITTLETQRLGTVQERSEFHRLLTVPGIGKILALTSLSEIGQIARFQDAREFSSYCRVVPGVAPSGPVSRLGRHAKQGSPHLTWAFSQAAL
jgi:transposase